jgi:hypothetical protein
MRLPSSRKHRVGPARRVATSPCALKLSGRRVLRSFSFGVEGWTNALAIASALLSVLVSLWLAVAAFAEAKVDTQRGCFGGRGRCRQADRRLPERTSRPSGTTGFLWAPRPTRRSHRTDAGDLITSEGSIYWTPETGAHEVHG